MIPIYWVLKKPGCNNFSDRFCLVGVAWAYKIFMIGIRRVNIKIKYIDTIMCTSYLLCAWFSIIAFTLDLEAHHRKI